MLSDFRFLEVIENTLILISNECFENFFDITLAINKLETLKVKSIEILINSLISVPSKYNVNIPDYVKAFFISKSQKNREYSLLFELCDMLIKNDKFGTKYEVNIKF